MFDFSGRVALVTGAGSGIGRAIALNLARQGARVVVTDIHQEAIDQVVAEITAAGGSAAGFRQDTSVRADNERAVAYAVETFGGLHHAVNNAGIGGQPTAVGETDLDAWDRTVSVNLSGVMYGMRYELPAIEQSGGGSIVNMASVHSLVATGIGNSAYTTAKHGLIGLTKQAAVDYGARGVRVNAVLPGYIKTPLLAQVDQAFLDTLVAKHPAGRLGEPEEVATLTAFLLSDEASFITASAHLVDGGYCAL